MQLDIYAWNAGNLDGASGTYEGADSEKTRAQYPNGYASLAKAAGAIGTKFGAWYGADGLGSTEEKSRERYSLWSRFAAITILGCSRWTECAAI